MAMEHCPALRPRKLASHAISSVRASESAGDAGTWLYPPPHLIDCRTASLHTPQAAIAEKVTREFPTGLAWFRLGTQSPFGDAAPAADFRYFHNSTSLKNPISTALRTRQPIAPMQTLPQSPPPLPPQQCPGWWARNWKWCVPAALVTLVALGVALVILIFSFVFGMMKGSTPYQDAVARARANPEVRNVLGTPIEEGSFTTGSLNTVNDSGSANLAIPISGPHGKATIHVEAMKSSGKWTYSRLEVEIPGHANVSLAN